MFLQKYASLFLGALFAGIFAGIASAVFLLSLDFLTGLREQNHSFFYVLPFAGMAVVWIYENIDPLIKKGNALVFNQSKGISTGVPFLMAPAVLTGTLITHFFGGSAGREGTAVQMSGAMIDGFAQRCGIDSETRKKLLVCGIAAGFAAVFGTPWAGVIFAFEVSKTKPWNVALVAGVLLAAFAGYWVCNVFLVQHTHYQIGAVPALTAINIGVALFAGVAFGLTAGVFVWSIRFFSIQFSKIPNPYLRVFIGGSIVLAGFLILGNSRLHGLGVSTILEAFHKTESPVSFLVKIVLTAITVTSGMKGGEVTPLFLIGSLLGSALSAFMPLPTALLAGLGFVAVFAGASKTPVACLVLGLEIFGISAWPFLLITCLMSFFTSGKKGIYD